MRRSPSLSDRRRALVRRLARLARLPGRDQDESGRRVAVANHGRPRTSCVATVTVDPRSGQPDREVAVVGRPAPDRRAAQGKTIRVENIKTAESAAARRFGTGRTYLLPLHCDGQRLHA